MTFSRCTCALFAIILILGCAPFAAGKSFMPRADTREEVEASLLAELAATFRPSATKDRIISLEAIIRPMYKAVPQEEDGTLQHTVVRYVLHRFFAKRGWFIRGLEPEGGSAVSAHNISGSESLQGLQEWVPSYLQEFLEKLAGGRGITLRELAVLAATIEDLIHKETIGRLEMAFQALELPLNEKLDERQTREVLEVFMMIYMLSGNFTISGRAAVQRAHNLFVQKVKDWKEVQEWMFGIMQKVHPTNAALDFEEIGRVVEEIGVNYATYNAKECGSLKAELLDVESQKAGRVRFADFYKKGLSGVFEFNEKADYLRDLGALDESDHSRPHVIVANYVGSRPNCLAASNFYAICCRNECEDLMGKLENALTAENAAPEDILRLVATISSDTVAAPRKLSSTMIQRLNSIAENNDGQVPLHGRLFSQWMHHAFPRECPFPHEEGSTNPQTPDEWLQTTGYASTKASTDDIHEHISSEKCQEWDTDCSEKPTGTAARGHHHFAENELPWSETEKLLLPKRALGFVQRPTGLEPRRPYYQQFGIFVLLFSMASAFVWLTKSAFTGDYAGKQSSKGRSHADFMKDTCKWA